MPRRAYDAIVVGLGAVGSATLYALSQARGLRVLGLERFRAPHHRGSSHGESRIARKAIGEGDAYVPLALRSFEIFRELELQSGASLLTTTGGLWISSSRRKAETHVKDFFANTLAAAKRFGIAHEVLTADQIRKGFPQFRIAGNEQGYYEPDAAYLRPEACVDAFLRLATARGVELRSEEPVESFDQQGGVVRVSTAAGEYEAGHLLLCAGAWTPRMLGPELAQLFTVRRQVVYWFDVEAAYAQYAPPRFPVWIWELQDMACVLYGVPAIDGPGGGAKVATEQFRWAIRPDAIETMERIVGEAETREMHRNLVAPHMNGMGSRVVKAMTCLYTSTPDFQFVIDRLPQMDRVILASACSGHGFKHSPAVGEGLAAMARGDAPPVDLGAFSLRRFDRAARFA